MDYLPDNDLDRLDMQHKTLYNRWQKALKTMSDSEYPEPEAEQDIAVWKGVMATRKKITESYFKLDIAESRLAIILKIKKI